MKTVTFAVVIMVASSYAVPTPPKIKRINVDNLEDISDYASKLEDYKCTAFHPSLKDPVDIATLDINTLDKLLVAYAAGDEIEFCVAKESSGGDLVENREKLGKSKSPTGTFWADLWDKFTG